MNREFLKSLGLEEEAIEKIMAEHGKTVEKFKNDAEDLKTKNAEITNLKEQLKTANKQISDFKDMDIDSIKKSAEEYKAKAEEAERNSKAEIDKLKFDFALDGALTGAKAKNTKAVKALLNMENLKLDNGEIVGLKEQIEKIQKENDYLFNTDDAAPPSFSKGTQGRDGKATLADSVKAAMGLPTETK